MPAMAQSRPNPIVSVCFGWLLVAGALAAPQAPGGLPRAFTSHDDYTEYQLLDPSSHQFRIVYFLNQRETGAAFVLNQTRSGSEGSGIAVFDPRTGAPLKFDYKTGAELTAMGTPGRLAAAEHYIRAHLPRPVPEGGEGRVRIVKTYLDDKSYFTQGDDIVFARSLGIGRNGVVLPAGYQLVSTNVAAQVYPLADGRLKVAFENIHTYASDVNIRARRMTTEPAPGHPVVRDPAAEFRKTLYDLGDPATHRIVVRHQYVETRPGAEAPVDLLGTGTFTDVTVVDLDSATPLTLSQTGGAPRVRWSSPLASDQTAHVRVTATLVDPAFAAEAVVLRWTRALTEPRATIMLPAGWELLSLDVPATVTRQGDRVVVLVVNNRPDVVTMTLRAVRRPAA